MEFQRIIYNQRIYLIFFLRQIYRVSSKRVILAPGIFSFFFIFYLVSPVPKFEFFSDSDVKAENYLNEYKHWLRHKQTSINESKYKIILPNERKIDRLQLYGVDFLILEYTKFFYQTKFCHLFNETERDFEFYKRIKSRIYLDECPYKNCIFTCNKSMINDASALLFNSFDLKRIDNRNFLKDLKSNIYDRKSQIWILWNDEVNLKINLF